jgi:hypothetical protein
MEENRMKRLVILVVLAAVLLPWLTSACENIRVGYVGNNVGNHIEGSYRYFDGTQTKNISARTGETVAIQYSSLVEEGDLSMTVLDADGNVQAALSANTTGSAELQAPEDEKYRLVIEGSHTKGHFSVSWNVR